MYPFSIFFVCLLLLSPSDLTCNSMTTNKHFQTNKHMREYLYGINPVLAALRARLRQIDAVIVQADKQRSSQRLQHILQLAQQQQLKTVPVHALDKLLGGEVRHQGIALHCSPRKLLPIADLQQQLVAQQHNKSAFSRLVLLEDVHDPMNLGAILRSAYGFGAAAALLTASCAPLSAVVSRASAGAMELLPLFSATRPKQSLVQTVNQLKRECFWILGASSSQATNGLAADDENHGVAGVERGQRPQPARSQSNKPTVLSSVLVEEIRSRLSGAAANDKLRRFKGVVLVLGNEGEGLTAETQRSCDAFVRIPMSGRDESVDSLNVSVAAGILLHQLQTAAETLPDNTQADELR